MNNIDLRDYINELYDLYGELLTEKQRDIVEKYYFYNLSLKEISEELNISRTAVLDSLKHASDNLIYYEEKIQLFSKIKNIEQMEIPKKYLDKILKELK